MINVTRLYCDKHTPGDRLRYPKKGSERKPVVVWNCTSACNLKCVHCYSEGLTTDRASELTTAQAKEMIHDLAAFGVPVLLFSGGEPLMRDDIFELASRAQQAGIRTVLSTNGTLITSAMARKIRETGFAYVGISLDGVGDTNDEFRGVRGAFAQAVRGIENCISIGQHVGLRFTMTGRNIGELPAIFDLIGNLDIPRACFYHLVYTGRGADMIADDLTGDQKRQALDLIIDKAAAACEGGQVRDILTVDNHCDGPYIYMRMLREKREDAPRVLELLRANGGNSSGIGIGCIDNVGNVHPDQFWQSVEFGNVRKRPFSDIWTDVSHPIMRGLKDRKQLLTGRCSASNCRWVDVCNGNFRVRADAVHGDPWMEDPACYLSDEEISRQES